MKKAVYIGLLLIFVLASCTKNNELEQSINENESNLLNLKSKTSIFTDISGNWAEAEITYMKNNGFMAGYEDGTFKPNNILTRAEFATMIASVLNPAEKPEFASRNFTDISTHWAKPNILKIARSGFMNGYTDGTFKPDNKITKTEIIIAISNGLNLTGGDVNSLSAYFDDASQIPSWATTSIANAAINHFIPNNPNIRNFEPTKNATRAEATVLLYQALVKKGTATAINNQFLVRYRLSVFFPATVNKGQLVTFSGKAAEITQIKFFVDNNQISSPTVTNYAYTFNYTFSSTASNQPVRAEAYKNGALIATYNGTITVLETSTIAIPSLVLMYHEITANPTFSSDVSINNFREQMQWLKNNGYTTISTDDLFMGTLPAKSVMITFDDGYEGNYINAKPILESLNMKAEFFVHTNYVGVPSTTPWNHMTWTQLRTLDASPLFGVYSHTKTHPYLTQITANQLIDEITNSKQKLETELGGVRNYFAYPYGDYNASVITAAQAAGYSICFAVEDKGLFGKPRQFSIPRKGIGKDITTIQLFKKRIGL